MILGASVIQAGGCPASTPARRSRSHASMAARLSLFSASHRRQSGLSAAARGTHSGSCRRCAEDAREGRRRHPKSVLTLPSSTVPARSARRNARGWAPATSGSDGDTRRRILPPPRRRISVCRRMSPTTRGPDATPTVACTMAFRIRMTSHHVVGGISPWKSRTAKKRGRAPAYC